MATLATAHAEKMLRKQLEKELGMELSSKKALIRTEVGRVTADRWWRNQTQHT